MSRTTTTTLPAALTKAVPAKPTEISIETLPDLFAHHRAVFGGWSMTQSAPDPIVPGAPGFVPPAGPGAPAPGAPAPGAPGAPPPGAPAVPQRPDGVTDEEWAALGDQGRVALSREREARQAAERALAAARARPTPPGGQQQPAAPAAPPPAPAPAPADGQPDFAKLITDAVAAAVKPFQERQEQSDAQTAATKIADAVMAAAKDTFHDPTDALAIDLTAVTDGSGNADPTKIAAQLQDLMVRKPHLVKPGAPRTALPGYGTTPSTLPSLDDKVKSQLEQMQQAAGIRPPSTP